MDSRCSGCGNPTDTVVALNTGTGIKYPETLTTSAPLLDPTDRVTCRTHRRWLHECVASPVHTNPAIGYRWCRRCDHQALVAVDELAGDVAIRCGLCGRVPRSRANEELVELCRRSLALARAGRFPETAVA